jgi:hypothetical protein
LFHLHGGAQSLLNNVKPYGKDFNDVFSLDIDDSVDMLDQSALDDYDLLFTVDLMNIDMLEDIDPMDKYIDELLKDEDLSEATEQETGKLSSLYIGRSFGFEESVNMPGNDDNSDDNREPCDMDLDDWDHEGDENLDDDDDDDDDTQLTMDIGA